MKVLIVVGARPNFMKVAPIMAAIRVHNERLAASGSAPANGAIKPILVHTGQHYDALMSDAFFRDLNLPAPDINLGVGSASPNLQTAEILKAFETVLQAQKPEVVIVVGDVNSTVAAAIATAKVSFDAQGRRPLLAHVEAGLRSFDRLMPEEINRIVTDQLSDLLFVTEPSGIKNLIAEGVSPDKMHFVGNTMIDSVIACKERADNSDILDRLGMRSNGSMAVRGTKPYALLTLHRPANVDNRETLQGILAGIEELAAEHPVIFPVHPRTKDRLRELGVATHSGLSKNGSDSRGVMAIDPLGYLEFLCVMKHAAIVVTDSGGIQEETTCLGVPCVTARENTERPATIEHGTNILAGTSTDGIKVAIRRKLSDSRGGAMPEKWDGRAAERIVDTLTTVFGARAH